MRISERQLRRMIKEEASRVLDECPNPEGDMPCPIETAAKMRSAGASEADVLHWVQLLISEFSGGHEEAHPPEEMPLEPLPIYDEPEGLMDDPHGGG